jgi:hypothetical protein
MICLETFEPNQTLSALPCGHGRNKDIIYFPFTNRLIVLVMHLALCMEEFVVSDDNLCPVCRQSIL